eukprot:Selendium_serpulae@DN6441_c0_g1_i14.p1
MAAAVEDLMLSPDRASLKRKHFLTLLDYSPQEIDFLLRLSHALKEKKKHRTGTKWLEGMNIVLIFEKSSTRTKSAFEVAAHDEGAFTASLAGSHFAQKESVEDSAKVLGRMYDGIGFRGYSQATVVSLAKFSGSIVWNGLTDDLHPTQFLADIMTIQEHLVIPGKVKSLKDIKFVFLGDCRNNVATSLMYGCVKLGIKFVNCCPESLSPSPDVLEKAKKVAAETGAEALVEHDVKTAVAGAHVLYTDVWVSMGEAGWDARIKECLPYQVTMQMLKDTNNPDVLFLHCLPAFHDLETDVGKQLYKDFGMTAMEVTDEAFRSRHSVVFDEAENRLHTIKAIMVATLSEK